MPSPDLTDPLALSLFFALQSPGDSSPHAVVARAKVYATFLTGDWKSVKPGPGQVASVAIATAGGGYTSAPMVTFVGGEGTGATATAFISNGMVSQIEVTTGGTAFITPPAVMLSGGGATTPATAVAFLTAPAPAPAPVTNTGTVSTTGTITQKPLS